MTRTITAFVAALAFAVPLVPTAGAGASTPAERAATKNGDLVFVSHGRTVSSQPKRAPSYDGLVEGEVPEYAPDGRSIAFLRDGLFVWDIATRTERQVSTLDGDGLAWSPDGRHLLVSHGSDLDEVDVGTGAVRHVHTEVGATVTEPAWSPNGRRIAFSTGATIRLVRPDGTGLRSLTKVGTLNTDPDWSPDSQTIAFITDRYVTDPSQRRARAELVTLPKSGRGEPVRVSHLAYPRAYFLIGVAWAPDGTRIAALQFNRNALPDAEDTDERFKVRAYRADGSHSYSLTGPIVGDDGPEGLDWAPRVR